MENKGIYNKLFKEDIEKAIYYATNSIKCKHCGHSMLLGGRDRRICSWCHNYIYKDDETEFKYKLKEMLIKEKKNENIQNNKKKSNK